MSPELINGQPYDVKSDIWALGCLIYELCAGQCVPLSPLPPYLRAHTDSEHLLQPSVPRGPHAARARRPHPRGQDPRAPQGLLASTRPGRQGHAPPERASHSLLSSSSSAPERALMLALAAEATPEHGAAQGSRRGARPDPGRRASQVVRPLFLSSLSLCSCSSETLTELSPAGTARSARATPTSRSARPTSSSARRPSTRASRPS